MSASAQPESPAAPRSPAPLWLAWVVACAWFALHAWAPGGPPRATWGVDTWEAWPPGLRWAVALALAVLTCPVILTPCVSAVTAAWAGAGGREMSRPQRAGIAVLFAALCWFGRSGNIYHGDGITVAMIARSYRTLLHYTGFDQGYATAEQVVEFVTHHLIYRALHAPLGLESYDTIALTHAVCAAGLVWLLTALFAAWWPSRAARQRIALTMFLSLGVIQLWFGHVETYTIGSTACVGFLLAGTRALRGETGLWRPALWVTVAMTMHTVFGGLMLGLAWVWWRRTRDAAWSTRVREAVWLAAPLLLTVTAVVLTYRLLGYDWSMITGFAGRGAENGATFVPWASTSNPMERYTFVSAGHALDILNETALTAGFGMPLLIGLLIALRARPFRTDPIPGFLVASTLVYFGVVLVINPPGGGRREWDVFAPPAIGYGLLAMYLLLTYVDTAVIRQGLAGLCAIAGAVHTVPWVAANARIDLPAHIEYYGAAKRANARGLTGTALLDAKQALAILSTPELAALCGDLSHALGDDTAALEYYASAAAIENRSELANFQQWEHVLIASGAIHETRGDDTAARTLYMEAIALAERRNNPAANLNPAFEGLSRIAERLGDMEAARRWRERAASVTEW